MPRKKQNADVDVAPDEPTPMPEPTSISALPTVTAAVAPERTTYRTVAELHSALASATGADATKRVWRNAAGSHMFVVRKHRPAECPTCTGRK